MGKVSIQDIAKIISDKYGLSCQEAEAFVSAVFDVISYGLDTEKMVKVKGLGTFKVIDVRERESVNVNTGERVVIGGHGKITFTPDAVMRDLVNKPFAQFETVVLNEGVDMEEMGRVQVADGDVGVETAIEPGDNVEVMDTGVSIENSDGIPTEILDGENAIDDLGNSSQTGVFNQAMADEPTDLPELADEPEGGIDDDSSPVEASNVEGLNERHEDEPNNGYDNEVEELPKEVVSPADKNKDESDGEGDEPVPDADCSSSDESVSLEPVDNSSSQCYKGWVLFVSVLFIGVLALAVGYFWGRNSVEPIVRYKTVHIVGKPQKNTVVRDTVGKDSTVTVALKADTAERVKPKEERNVPQDFSPAQSQTLKNAKAIVETGAYRIVGTAKTITVKEGETLESISRSYFGEGMECYIQVHNGVEKTKAGMLLKIPKLELKRKR